MEGRYVVEAACNCMESEKREWKARKELPRKTDVNLKCFFLIYGLLVRYLEPILVTLVKTGGREQDG